MITDAGTPSSMAASTASAEREIPACARHEALLLLLLLLPASGAEQQSPPPPPPHSAAAFSASLCALAVILPRTSSGTQSSIGSGLTTMSVIASWSETVPRTATTTARRGRSRQT